MLYDTFVKPALFNMDPESVHEHVAKWMRSPLMDAYMAVARGGVTYQNDLSSSICGIPLENPVGLAAGFDKNAKLVDSIHKFGFGFAEIGTVTGWGQPGNPRPRMFRLPDDQALINRMGFNNEGANAAAKRLARRGGKLPVGGNIGKTKATPLERAVEDYARSFELLAPYVDYFVVNVSSPNTPGLRSLQEKKPLKELLDHLTGINRQARPILLKIAPDLTDGQLEDIAEVVRDSGIQGLIATNTTISREGLRTDKDELARIGAGGLSGGPLRTRSTEVLARVRGLLPKRVDLVGVGGICRGSDAYRKILAGASSVQIYTGFIYGGPTLVYRVLRELDALLTRDGFRSIKEAVGAGLR